LDFRCKLCNSKCHRLLNRPKLSEKVKQCKLSGGYINGRNSANLELLIDKTSSIYLYVNLKALASWIFLSFTSFEETPTHMRIKIFQTIYQLLLHMVFTSRNWFAMQGPVAIILISWSVIFIWETGYWTRAIKRFALFENSANLELLTDKTSSIYLYVKLKALASWIFLSFTSFWRNSDSYEYKNKSAVSDLRQVGGFLQVLRFPPIKLTATI
jgi:hypothetical protein